MVRTTVSIGMAKLTPEDIPEPATWLKSQKQLQISSDSFFLKLSFCIYKTLATEMTIRRSNIWYSFTDSPVQLYSINMSLNFFQITWFCRTLLKATLLELFKTEAGWMLNPPKIVHCWRIQHWCGNIFVESKQHRLQVL